MTEAKPRWEVRLTRQAEKTLYRLSKPLLRRLDRALLDLAKNPRPTDSHPLAGYDKLYRLPVEVWRITYTLEEELLIVLVLEIAPLQQPERYRLEEEAAEDSLPERFQQAQTVDPAITFLGLQHPREFGVKFGTVEDFIRPRGFSLLKRIERKKIRVLIAEGLAETRENLGKLLSIESDIEVVGTAKNGEEAVQMAVERQPDVVLLDTNLPGVDSFAACEQISQQLPSTQVILMSAWETDDYTRRAMMAGAREFLIKPFSRDELMTSIRRVHQSAAALHNREAFNDLKQHLLNKLVALLEPTIDVLTPEEVRQAVQDKYERILSQENIILSRSERERLFENIIAEILQTELGETQKRALAQWFKFFKLGNKVEMSLAVADLSESLSFYEKLGLKKVDEGEKPYPWAVVSDGRFYLGLHQQMFSSPTLSYFTLHGLSERMDHLPKLGVKLDNVQKLAPVQGMQNNELLYGLKFITAEFKSPEGQRVLLAHRSSNVETTPSGRKFYTKYDGSTELSLPTQDLNAALAYWRQLGFECVTEGDQPYPWAILSDGLIRLGLHQTPKLTQPTLTYFAPNMPERLKRMRRRGITFVAERKDKKGRRVGAVVESPDGQRFFFFTGESQPPKPQIFETNGSFQVGQKVRIVAGPFADFIGTVAEIDRDRTRVTVQVAFFGQEKSLEFDFSQVERA
ncbi:MAG: response regulator [Anaerolineae bacterium]|nr:response regulator [Anaerolineae bacterium]